VTAEQLLGAEAFEATVGPLEAGAFVGLDVVIEDVGIEAGHGHTVGTTSSRVPGDSEGRALS
jgi:hypothetical protein